MPQNATEGFDPSTYSDRINVNPDIFKSDVRPHGGTRGKNEYRRSSGTQNIIGRHGSNTYYRGACWNCGKEMIMQRSQKRKQLHKCPDCGETSFTYKGFFNRDRFPVDEWEPPRPDELSEDCYVIITTYSGRDSVHYTTSGDVQEKRNGDFYDSVEIVTIIESNK